MTIEQAKARIKALDEMLDRDDDLFTCEEQDNIAKDIRNVEALIGLEEVRQKQLATYKPVNLTAWERGFLDSYVLQGHKCHYITKRQQEIFHRFNGWNAFQYKGFIFKYNKNALLVEHIAEESFLKDLIF